MPIALAGRTEAGIVFSPRAFPARQSRRALGRFPSHGSPVAGSDPHFAFAYQGSFPLSGFPGRAVAKANDPCHPGMASATAPKFPRKSCYSSSQGRCCMGLIGPPIRATAKCLPPGSLARSILPYPVTSAQRRMHDLQNSAGKVRFHRNLMPRLSRWVTQ